MEKVEVWWYVKIVKKKKNDKKNYNRIANVQIRLSTYLYSTVIIQE